MRQGRRRVSWCRPEIEHLLTDAPLRRRLGGNAAQDARCRFDLKRQAGQYLEWYEKLVKEKTGVNRDEVFAG